MHINIGEKLKTIRNFLELSQMDLAKKLDVSDRTLRDYEKNKFSVNIEFISKLINTFNVNPNWLFKDEGEIFSGDTEPVLKIKPMEKERTSDKNGLVYIPVLEIKAAAGSGYYVGDEKVSCLAAFNKFWLSNVVFASPQSLSAIVASGDSMEPTIKDGDFLLVDQSKNIPQDGIYVIRVGDTLIVKRIQCLPGYTIEIMSDNPKYKPYTVNLKNSDDVAIIGKVVWYGRTLG